ncbi:MAG TPA: ABC transporter permease, partial [Bryobacteraceae bacterium]|nr:ABC transporter permease [Bryobacteraceae bacterium]
MLREILTGLWLRIKALVMRRKLERDLTDELGFHMAMRQQKLEQNGLTAAEASAAARQRLGNPTLLRETSRSLWTFTWLDALGRDVRYAVRAMARSPVFAIVAILTLAFGIGANTAIFSIVNGILLRAMPYERPAELYSIREAVQVGSERKTMSSVNGGNILEWKRSAASFEAIAALEPTNDNLILGSDSVNVHGLRASASLFPLLGMWPRIGRSFTSQEDEMGHGLELILTDTLWRTRFGANPAIVGEKVSLNGYPATVIGVLPASFYFPKQDQLYGDRVAKWDSRAEYFLNLNLGPWERKPGIGNFNFAAIGRLHRGVTPQQALAELEAVEVGIGRQSSSGAT